MSYTENLHLRVIDNDENIVNIYTQGNSLATQLEALFGANYSDYQNLSTITADIEALENSVSALSSRADELSSQINSVNAQLGNRITACETQVTELNSEVKTITDDQGNVITGTMKKYSLTANSVGYVRTFSIDNRFLHIDSGLLEIDLTSAINLQPSVDAKLIAASCYKTINDSSMSSPLSLHSFGSKSGTYGKFIIFRAVNSYVNNNEEVTPLYEGGTYTVILDIFIPD